MFQRIKWAFALGMCSLLGNPAAIGQTLPNLFPFPNRSGLLETYNANGKPIDLTGPFFQSLGTNGRSCASCHRPAQGWTVSAAYSPVRCEISESCVFICSSVAARCSTGIWSRKAFGRGRFSVVSFSLLSRPSAS
jgi:hypothetical protein